MARYIDADALEKAVMKPSMFDINKEDVLALIADIPAADVAPRAEVAREIFEDIEKTVCENTYPDFDANHKPVNIWKACSGYDALDALKKKYTEEGK